MTVDEQNVREDGATPDSPYLNLLLYSFEGAVVIVTAALFWQLLA